MAYSMKTSPPKVLNEGVEMLRAAIVTQAVQDYVYLLKKPDCNSIDGWSRSRLESWFMSRDFTQFCSLDPKAIMKQCEVIAWQKKRNLKTR